MINNYKTLINKANNETAKIKNEIKTNKKMEEMNKKMKNKIKKYEAKKSFYENVANRYSKISHDPKKKSSHDYSNFNKRVLNWFFNQNEDIRMLLCSVENKKYTNTIYDAYSYILKHPNGVKLCFSEEDNR